MTPDARLTLRATEQVKYRYLRALDLKDWDGFAEVFEPDATRSYGTGIEFGSAQEIVTFMRESLGPDIVTVHQVHHPESCCRRRGLGAPAGRLPGLPGCCVWEYGERHLDADGPGDRGVAPAC